MSKADLKESMRRERLAGGVGICRMGAFSGTDFSGAGEPTSEDTNWSHSELSISMKSL